MADFDEQLGRIWTRVDSATSPEVQHAVQRAIEAVTGRAVPADDPELFEQHLRQLAGLAAAMESELQSAVLRAKHNGASWATIAKGLDVSRQATHERFSRFTSDAR